MSPPATIFWLSDFTKTQAKHQTTCLGSRHVQIVGSDCAPKFPKSCSQKKHKSCSKIAQKKVATKIQKVARIICELKSLYNFIRLVKVLKINLFLNFRPPINLTSLTAARIIVNIMTINNNDHL